MNKLSALSVAVLLAACSAPQATDPELDYRRAVNAFAEGRHDLARVYYASDLAKHPDRLESQRGLALAWLSGSGQSLEPALPVLESYLASVPQDDEIRRLYVRNLLLLGETSKAVAVARELHSPSERALLTAEALAAEDPLEAWQSLEPHLDPADSRAVALAASITKRLGDLPKALGHAQRAARLDPLRTPNWYLLGRLQLAAGEREAARRSLGVHQGLGQLTRGGPDGGPLSPIESLRVLDELGSDLPRESPQVRLLICRLRLEAGFIDQAQDDLPTVLETIGGGEGLELAEVLWRRGERAAAMNLYRQGLLEAPESRRARGGLVAALLAAEPGGDLDEARELLAAGLERDPHLARYHLLLGRLERAAGDMDRAAASLSHALELAPWNVPCRLELADLRLAAGNRQAASDLLDQAPERSPAVDGFRRARGLPPRRVP